MTDAEMLERLRRRAAKTENLGTLRHIADETSDLAGIAPECLLSDIADCQDRIQTKILSLGGTPVPRRPRGVVHNGVGNSPQVKMIIGQWTVDEFGNRSRQVYADPDGPALRL
jgi:hypothetical protein